VTYNHSQPDRGVCKKSSVSDSMERKLNMSSSLFEVILVYATIPFFTLVLFLLVLCIAKFQLGVSFFSFRMPQRKLVYPLSTYLCVGLLFLFLVAVTVILRRRRFYSVSSQS
jgi:hypothetical protein